MALQPEQDQLLVDMIEAARKVPRPQQGWLLTPGAGQAVLSGPWGERDVLSDDVYELENAELLRATTHNYLYGNQYVISPAGLEHYARLRHHEGEAIERQEQGLRRFIDSDAFREAYPSAYARWAESEELLWGANSERELTTVGHKCREVMQEFATEVVARFRPEAVDPDPAKVNRRLGAAVAMHLQSLGDARARLLMALGDYSEATMDVIQRQEHGGQKEGHALTWEDARRVVFHSASVMYEFALSLEEASAAEEPPAAFLEPGWCVSG